MRVCERVYALLHAVVCMCALRCPRVCGVFRGWRRGEEGEVDRTDSDA